MTGAPTLTAVSADFSEVGGMVSVAMVDDGTGQDAAADDGVYTASFSAADTLSAGSYDVGVSVSGMGAMGALNDSTDLALTVSDAPAITLSAEQVVPDTVFNKASDARAVNFSVTATTVGGASLDTNGVSVDLSLDETAGTTVGTFVAGTPSGNATPHTLAFTVPANTDAGAYSLTINGTANSGALTDSANLTLTVREHVETAAIAFDSITDSGTLQTLTPGASANTGTVVLMNPFAVRFYGSTVAAMSSFTAGSNATLGIGTAGIPLVTTPTNAAGYDGDVAVVKPSLALFHHAPLVEDGTETPAKGIWEEVQGTAPNRSWVIEWYLDSDATAGGTVQVQAVFHETPATAGSDFEIRFGTMDVLGASPQNYSVVGVRDDTLNDDIIVPNSTAPGGLSGTAYLISY
ncbi:MAG: choice-of-anchor X domain-containing protein [Myxococcota bacterium]